MNYRNGETREIKDGKGKRKKQFLFSFAFYLLPFYLEYFSRVLIGGVVDIAEVD